ncbi:TPA: hypothetical protein DEW47_03920 [Patescibacteria group bacterium]|nr:MAG: hypothetical protein UT71_C0003G0034 [Parcubacteria group bacterium GW2011_GWF2_40_10]KKR47992.1 MAG: hypothetical protein UT83_C0001G0035 [Parcubacteria group bacterium GW2011_GWA2_40_143]KKR60472.1 MAG: hypothetical protein UT97_C0001G0043 [Parcubacteria group bacterium GW2011_GWC2_40_31]KKR74540.1 MAG: hypothetical protein UU18_C0024G0008 [Parcubacteria group bacterium GW2011_GWB2_40_8]KKR81009.1 MAG: hypothetical protein UU28_C0029G0007 [Parcubacteria group bacterium GW2011_GWD2_40_
MNKYIILSIAVIVLGIGAAIGFSGNKDEKIINRKSEPQASASSVVAINPHYDFGDIDIFGGKVETGYVLQNTGDSDVVILSGGTSCMCTEGVVGDLNFGMHGSSGKVIIPAGGEKTLTAIFDPMAHGPEGVGPIKREIFLKTNSTVTPEIKVTFAGNVIKN